jgi:hypothetical protein
MTLTTITNYWKSFVGKLNSNGVPLPTIRDPKTGKGSISLTLVFISFNAVLIGLVGKWSGALGGIDIAQALNLFYACAALYWGRKFQGKEVSFEEKVDSASKDQGD